MKLELCGISHRGEYVCVVNCMRFETVTEWDVRQGKGHLCCQSNANWIWNRVRYHTVDRVVVFSTACKINLELRVISDMERGFYVVKIMQIETGTTCDIRQGKEGIFCQQHAN
jgi:hypothetical protein